MYFIKISLIYVIIKKEFLILKFKGYNIVKINLILVDNIICMKSNLLVGYFILVCENFFGDLSFIFY